jgi:hypothetical protein
MFTVGFAPNEVASATQEQVTSRWENDSLMPSFAAFSISERTFRYIIWAIIALGAALRITVWWQDRSLFIDEANLLRNCIELPYGGLFDNLGYHQYAPPLFCTAQKWMLSTFGVHDRVARLLPLLSGLAVLVLYYRVAGYYLSRPALAMSLLFLALGEPFFRYGTEAKQYATDMLTTLLLLAFVLHRPGSAPVTARRWYFLGATGIAVVWWSMPAVFVLAAIAAYYTVISIQAKNNRNLVYIALCGFAWLLSFGAYYWLILGQDVDAPGLQSAHVFFDWPGLDIVGWANLFTRVRGLGTTAVGFTFFSNLAYWAGLLTVIYALWRFRKPEHLLIVLPIALCMVASALHLYAVTERLSLFFMPLLLVLLGLGWEQLLRWGKPWTGPVLALVVLAAALSRNPLGWFFRPYEVVEVRQALLYVRAQAQPNDRVYAHPDTGPSTYHYTRLSAQPLSLPNVEVSRGLPQDELKALYRRFPKARIWIIWNAQDIAPAREAFGEDGVVEKRADFAGCSVYLARQPGY